MGVSFAESLVWDSCWLLSGSIGRAPAVAADDTTHYYNFTGAVSTDWMDVANWNDIAAGNVPQPFCRAGSTADISGGLTATIGTAANPNPTINVEQVYIGGDADLHGPPDPANPNPTPPPPFLQYPAVATGNGELDQNAGTLNVGVVDPANTTSNNGWFVLGHVHGSTGTYKMSGTAALNLNGNDLVQIGTHGTGVLSMAGSSTITTPAFARAAGETGRGRSRSATLRALRLKEIFASAIKARATLTQNGGTITTMGGWLDVGRETGSHGTYTMNSGTLNLGGDLNVGNDGNGIFKQSGATTVNQTGGWIKIGAQDNTGGENNGNPLAPATGSYTMSGTVSLTTTGRIYVGGSGNAIPAFGAPRAA